MTGERSRDCGAEAAMLRICGQRRQREMSCFVVQQLWRRATILEAAQMTAEIALGPGIWERYPKARDERLRQVSPVFAALSQLVAGADDAGN